MNAHERAHDGDDEIYVATNLSDSVQDMGVMPVPLPLEIPPPPNLSQLPAHILHSGTVETLIGQNEDLMARLKVNIRRNSILEQHIMEQERQTDELKRAHTVLLEQYQVLQEKDEMVKEKNLSFTLENEALRDQQAFMQAKVDAAEERRDELHAGLAFERSYRRRIRAWVRPLLDNLKAKEQLSETRIDFLERQLSAREAAIGDLRERLETTTTQLQTANVGYQQNQAKLVEGYEARLAQAESEAARAKGECVSLKEKVARLDDAVTARTTAENRIIALERANQEMSAQVTSFRQEAKAIAAGILTAQKERDEAMASSIEAKSELQRAQDQFESLQAVWSEAQKKLESSKLQQDSLNKLNQELSRQLKTARKAAEASPTSVTSETTTSAALSPEATSERLEKIDAILVELESGFKKNRDLGFIENESL